MGGIVLTFCGRGAINFTFLLPDSRLCPTSVVGDQGMSLSYGPKLGSVEAPLRGVEWTMTVDVQRAEILASEQSRQTQVETSTRYLSLINKSLGFNPEIEKR